LALRDIAAGRLPSALPYNKIHATLEIISYLCMWHSYNFSRLVNFKINYPPPNFHWQIIPNYGYQLAQTAEIFAYLHKGNKKIKHK